MQGYIYALLHRTLHTHLRAEPRNAARALQGFGVTHRFSLKIIPTVVCMILLNPTLTVLPSSA